VGPAGFWRRLAALIIDCLLMSLVFVVFLGLSMIAMYSWTYGKWLGFACVYACRLVAIIAPPLYFWLMTAFLGRTVGKMALGIRVVNAAGRPPGVGWALLRETMGKFLSGIALGIGYIWAAFDPQKRAWHDKIARTSVIVGPARQADAGTSA